MTRVPFRMTFTGGDGTKYSLMGPTIALYTCGVKRADGVTCGCYFFSSMVVDRIPCPLCHIRMEMVVGTIETVFAESPPSAPQPVASRTAPTVDIRPPNPSDITPAELMADEEENKP